MGCVSCPRDAVLYCSNANQIVRKKIFFSFVKWSFNILETLFHKITGPWIGLIWSNILRSNISVMLVRSIFGKLFKLRTQLNCGLYSVIFTVGWVCIEKTHLVKKIPSLVVVLHKDISWYLKKIIKKNKILVSLLHKSQMIQQSFIPPRTLLPWS